MSSRNQLLLDIATARGIVTDLSAEPRNVILEALRVSYGGSPAILNQASLLRSIDAAINTTASKKTRNEHIKDIATGLGALGLTDDMSRNELLAAWLANA